MDVLLEGGPTFTLGVFDGIGLIVGLRLGLLLGGGEFLSFEGGPSLSLLVSNDDTEIIA